MQQRSAIDLLRTSIGPVKRTKQNLFKNTVMTSELPLQGAGGFLYKKEPSLDSSQLFAQKKILLFGQAVLVF